MMRVASLRERFGTFTVGRVYPVFARAGGLGGASAVCLDNFDDDVSDAGRDTRLGFGQTARTNAYTYDETNPVFTFDADSGAPRFAANFRLELFFGSTC